MRLLVYLPQDYAADVYHKVRLEAGQVVLVLDFKVIQQGFVLILCSEA